MRGDWVQGPHGSSSLPVARTPGAGDVDPASSTGDGSCVTGVASGEVHLVTENGHRIHPKCRGHARAIGEKHR
eukprot:5547180-Pyramimonas_sp.AAC.1